LKEPCVFWGGGASWRNHVRFEEGGILKESCVFWRGGHLEGIMCVLKRGASWRNHVCFEEEGILRPVDVTFARNMLEYGCFLRFYGQAYMHLHLISFYIVCNYDY
jgi:hypothetical protein